MIKIGIGFILGMICSLIAAIYIGNKIAEQEITNDYITRIILDRDDTITSVEEVPRGYVH